MKNYEVVRKTCKKIMKLKKTTRIKLEGNDLSDLKLPEPWSPVKASDQVAILEELKSEISENHKLFTSLFKYDNEVDRYVLQSVKPIARDENGKVILELASPYTCFAVVQLTWQARRENLSNLPKTDFFNSLDEVFNPPDENRVIDHPMPHLWNQNPFNKQFDSLQNSKGKIDDSTRYFSLNERVLQNLIARTRTTSSKRRTIKEYKKLIEKLNRDEIFSDVFSYCSQGDKTMTKVWGGQILKHCEHLCLLSEDGNVAAIQSLAEIAILVTRGLERVVSKNLESLQFLAAYEYAWPVMQSPVTSLSSPLPDWKALGLGSAFNFDFNSKKRLRLDTPVGKFAWKLLICVINLKRVSSTNVRSYVGQNERKVCVLDNGASKLPHFNSTSVSQWWNVAKKCLIKMFPNSEKYDELNEKHPELKDLVTASSQMRSPKVHRAHIFEKLEEQFRSIASVPRHSGKKNTFS